MAHHLPDAVTAIASGAAAATLSGRPPEEVIVWSIFGAIVAVWISSNRGTEVSLRWAINAALVLMVSVLCGIVGSALFLSVAPEYGFLQPFAKAPQWVVAFITAALIHTFAPLVYEFTVGWMRKKGGSNDAPPAV